MTPRPPPRSGNTGFTLIELIIVITVMSILAAVGAGFIARPIEGFVSVSRRARLVDAGETALRRLQRDVRQALPNSLRIACGGKCLELLHVAEGGRYRAEGPGNILDFTVADADGFEVMGQLQSAPSAGQSVVVYNTSPSAAAGNAYVGDNRTGVGAGSSDTAVLLDPAFKFPFTSPQQRFFIVDEAVTFYCDTDAQTLTRYAGYAIQAAQPTAVGALGTGALMADHITACSFSYQPGTSQRAGLLTARLTAGTSGETITLLQQVHVSNAP